MAGITKYERMRRQYGEGSVAMIHHVCNKWNSHAFQSDLTMQTMDEFIEAMGGKKNYTPIRTYYIVLKQYPADWELEQYHLAQCDEPQKQKVKYF